MVRLLDVISMCKRATSFEFTVSVESSVEAEALWKLLRAAADCNGRPKRISVTLYDQHFWRIDWRFTNDFRVGRGSIQELVIQISDRTHRQPRDWTMPNWLRLGLVEKTDFGVLRFSYWDVEKIKI